MTVKELVSKCDVNCTVEIHTENGYLGKFNAGELFFGKDIPEFIQNQKIKDFKVCSESGYVFPIVKIFL